MISPILSCVNVQTAIDHYTNQLGFELAWAMPPNEKGETEFAGVRLGRAEIMLGVTAGFVEDSDLPKRGIGVQIYFNLPDSIDIAWYYKKVKGLGARIERPLELRPWGEQAFTVKDIDGYNLMFAQSAQE